MKKLSIALVVAALVALTAATASADPYNFEDMIDGWSYSSSEGWYPDPDAPSNSSAWIFEGSPLSYQHDITDSVDFGAGHKVTAASLELDFTNDGTDDVFEFMGTVFWDYREYAKIGFDGNGLEDITDFPDDDLDDGQYMLVLNIDWLNDDGLLDVTIDVYNDFGGVLGGTATAYLDHSRLYGTAVVPVPGAVLLGVLGLSAAGIKLRKNRAA
jgi:hypothetical protein